MLYRYSFEEGELAGLEFEAAAIIAIILSAYLCMHLYFINVIHKR